MSTYQRNFSDFGIFCPAILKHSLWQKQLNKQPSQQRNVPSPSPQKKKEPVVSKKQTSKDKSRVLEQRLNTIDNLYKKGILSEEEYQRKRNQILKGI